jgi:bifunctional non-homologous end joining protein LigD
MRSRRPGSKGTEWLLIKKRDEFAQEGFAATDDEQDYSVLTKRSMAEIGGDAESRRWKSNRGASAKVTAKKGKNAWLADAIRKHDAKSNLTTENTEDTENIKVKVKGTSLRARRSGTGAKMKTAAKMKNAAKKKAAPRRAA